MVFTLRSQCVCVCACRWTLCVFRPRCAVAHALNCSHFGRCRWCNSKLWVRMSVWVCVWYKQQNIITIIRIYMPPMYLATPHPNALCMYVYILFLLCHNLWTQFAWIWREQLLPLCIFAVAFNAGCRLPCPPRNSAHSIYLSPEKKKIMNMQNSKSYTLSTVHTSEDNLNSNVHTWCRDRNNNKP